MRRALAIASALALLLMAAGVALEADVALHGAVNLRPGGVSATTEALVSALSAAAVLGLALLLVAAGLGVILAGRRRQWAWLLVIAALAPVACYASLQAGFEADVHAGLASLLAPAVYLVYSFLPQRAPRGAASDA